MLSNMKSAISRGLGSESPAARQPTPLGMNRWIILIAYCYLVLIGGWTYFGWSGISRLLWKAGVYAEVCTPSSSNQLISSEHKTGCLCDDQYIYTTRLFTTAATSHFVFSIVAGSLMDTVGPRVVAALGFMMQTIGWLMLGLGHAIPVVPVIAFFLIGASSDCIYFPSLQIGSLFPGSTAFVSAVIGGFSSGSAAIGPIMALLVDSCGIDAKWFLVAYAVLVTGICVAIALVACPSRTFKTHDELMNPKLASSVTISGSLSSRFIEDIKGVFAQLKQFHIIGVGIIYGICMVVCLEWYNISSAVLLSPNSLNLLEIAVPLGFIAGILLGFLVDRITIVPVNMILLGLLTLGYAFLLVPVEGVQYISVLSYAAYTSISSLQFYLFYVRYVHKNQVGRMAGFSNLLGGLSSILGQMMYEKFLVEHLKGSPRYLPVVATVLLLCLYPILFLSWRRGEKARAMALGSA